MIAAAPAETAIAPFNVIADPPRPAWLARVDDDPAYEWARIAWRRAHAAPGAWFDSAKADSVVALWPKVFTLTEDRFAGLPFRLNLWQEIIVRLLVGWKIPILVTDPRTGLPGTTHVRLFRQLMLWIPRKNGKSEFLAALALLFFVLEGTIGGQGFCFGLDGNQAQIVLDKMKVMASAHTSLAREVTPFRLSLYISRLRSKFSALSGKPQGKHGRSTTVYVGDEMHEWTTLGLLTTLRQSTGARLQPMGLLASTAGPKTAAVGYGLWEQSQAILEGRIEDPTTLVVVFAAGESADWTDRKVWAAANPSLGLSPTLQFLEHEFAYAQDNPRAEAEFRCFHLNQWIEAYVRWLSLRKWDACAADKTAWKRFPEELKGRACHAALDVSTTQDITAKILLFPPERGELKHRLIARFWVPEDTLHLRVKNDHVPYDKWLAAGALSTTPGDYVDQNVVANALKEDLALYNVRRIGFDPWNATKLVTDLQADGVAAEKFLEVRQGIRTLGEPSKRFEAAVIAGTLDHGGHPVLRWMAGNVVIRFDENLNFMPAKKRSKEKIDGIAATVTAHAVEMNAPKPSVYETRGLRRL